MKYSSAWLTGLRMSTCGLFCFIITQYYHLPEGYWAIVTVASITRPGFSATFIKSLLRLIGTFIGAWIGFIAAVILGASPYALFLVILVFTTITTYIGVQTKPYDYLSIVAGFTAVIIMASHWLNHFWLVAFYRTFDVCLGIVIMAIVSGIMEYKLMNLALLIEKNNTQKILKVFQQIHFSKQALFYSLVVSFTASLSFLTWMVVRYNQGIWATITILVVMAGSIEATETKAWARFCGQVVAAVVGGMVAILFPNDIVMIGFVLGIGFFFCGMLIGGSSTLSTMGNQAGSALAIMLLAGFPNNAMGTVIARLLNVIVGIMIAMLVAYFLNRWIKPMKT